MQPDRCHGKLGRIGKVAILLDRSQRHVERLGSSFMPERHGLLSEISGRKNSRGVCSLRINSYDGCDQNVFLEGTCHGKISTCNRR
jgi:hypothetical protein